MFTKLFVFAIAIACATAEIPSYINVCGRRDPKIQQCILKNINNLKSKICEGIPELDVPTINPFIINDIKFIDSPNFKLNFKKIKILGFCNFNITEFRADIINLHYDFELKLDHIEFNIDYDFNMHLLVPIVYKGLANLTLDDGSAKISMDFTFTTINDKKYVYLSTMKLDIDIKEDKVQYQIIEEQVDQFLVIIHKFLGENMKELIDTLKPIAEKQIINQVFLISNNIIKHFTYDELFPDRI